MFTDFVSVFVILSKRGVLGSSIAEGALTLFAPSGNSSNSVDRILDSFMYFCGSCLNVHI